MTLQDAVIRKERVSDQIKSILKQTILEGLLKPGDKFPPETEIAQKYSVSKVSAREALRELEVEGLIVKKRGAFGGSFVAEPGSDKMVDVVNNSFLFGGVTVNDLAEFRQILEPGLAQLAAERRNTSDLKAMDACIRKVEQSIENGEPDQTSAIRFHHLIAEACHNRFISSLMEAVLNVFQQVLAKEPDLDTAKEDVRYNRKFYQYIKSQDGEKAQRIMARHFNTLEEIIKKRSLKGEF